MMCGQICLRIPYETVPLTDDFTIRKEDYFRENGGIIFPNPNAPTGVELGMQDVEAIIKANPDVIVVVDEAYVDFRCGICAAIDRKIRQPSGGSDLLQVQRNGRYAYRLCDG